MKKAIGAFIITLVIGVFCSAFAQKALYNLDELGVIAAVAVMGSLIIYFNEQKKK